MIGKIKFWLTANRIGPDMPLLHLALYSKRLMKRVCKRKFAYFGAGAEVRPGAYIIAPSTIALGKNVVIRPGTHLFGDPRWSGYAIEVSDEVLIGSGVHIYVANHNFEDGTCPIAEQGHGPVRPVKIMRGAWIGACAIILPGVVIGENAVVGAGSVVTRSVPDRCVAVGNPARIVKQLA